MLKKKLLGPRLYIPNAGGPGSIPGLIPGQGTRSHRL